MIQGLSKFFYGVLAVSGNYLPLMGGEGASVSVGLGLDQSRVPLPVACTLRNFTAQLYGAHGAVTLTVYKNGIATSLAVTYTSSDTIKNLSDSVAFSTFDDVTIVASGDFTNTLNVSVFLDVETPLDTQSVYGITAFAGTILVNTGFYGGGFNTGIAQSFTAGASLTKSLTAVDGTITGLVSKTFSGSPGTGVWTSYILLNGVLQDGGGGTVNTACVITGSSLTGSSAFSLPVSILDNVDIVTKRTVNGATFAIAHVACGVLFEADTDNYYMFCGGNNNVIPNAATSYRWLDNAQSNTLEADAQAIIGVTGITVHGFYSEFSGAPGAGNTWTLTLRTTNTDTPLTYSIADPNTTGQIIQDQAYIDGQTIDIKIVPASDPTFARYYWGIPVSATDVTPPPPPPPAPNGSIVRCERIFLLPTSPSYKRMFLGRIEFLIQTGVGYGAGQGSDPQVMVSISRDGGHSFGPEFWLSVGKVGEYLHRAYRNGPNGYYRNGAIKIATTDPNFVAWLSADADISEGNS